MPDIKKKRFENADERILEPYALLEVVKFGCQTAIRGTYEPGWRWSESDSGDTLTGWCEEEHFGFIVTGTMVFRMADGTEMEFTTGDLVSIPPGHDAWVIGSSSCVFLDFQIQSRLIEQDGILHENSILL